MLIFQNANQLEYEVQTAIKAVLFKSRIAFIDKYAYCRLFSACTGDKSCIQGKYNQRYLQHLVKTEPGSIEFDYCARKRAPRQLVGLHTGLRLDFYSFYLILYSTIFFSGLNRLKFA